MAVYSLTIETTNNATAGASGSSTAVQFIMPASRECRLLAVLVNQQATAAGESPGRWVVDRISAVATGSSLTPLKAAAIGPASAITDPTIAVSATLANAPTVANAAIAELAIGQWNVFSPNGRLPELRSGLNQGFAIRRSTAPTGARVCGITVFWEEDPT